MGKLMLVLFLATSTFAYSIRNYNFNIVFEKIDYGKVAKYETQRNIIENIIQLSEISKISASVKNLRSLRDMSQDEINQYADQMFTDFSDFIVHGGYDPVELPDQHAGFNYTLIITYHGELDLTQGWLEDLSTIHRGGDVLVDGESTSFIALTVPIAFDDLEFSYDYSAKIMGLGPTGGIEGKVSSLTTEVKIGFDTEKLVLSLENFYITHAGHITLHFTGNPLVDWLMNLLTDVATALLKEVILLRVEDVVRGSLGDIINQINDYLSGLTTPSSLVYEPRIETFFNQ